MALISLRSSKRTRSSYTIEFKLRVLDHTENESIHKTAAHFGIDKFRRNKGSPQVISQARETCTALEISSARRGDEIVAPVAKSICFSSVRNRNFISGKMTGPGSWHP